MFQFLKYVIHVSFTDSFFEVFEGLILVKWNNLFPVVVIFCYQPLAIIFLASQSDKEIHRLY